MESLDRIVREVRARLDTMVTRAVVTLVNDRLKTQRLQLTILDDETVDDIEHLQPYGVSFVPPVGSEALALAVGGSRSHTVAICAALPGERPVSAAPKTGGLYTDGSWRLFIDADGNVHLGAEKGAEPVALARKTDLEFRRIWQFLTTQAATATDGGAALKGSAAAPAGQVKSVAAQKVRAT